MAVLVPPQMVPLLRVVLLEKIDPARVPVGSRFRDGQVGTVRLSELGGPAPSSMVVIALDVLVECFARTEDDAGYLAAVVGGYLRDAAGRAIDGVPLRHVTATLPVDFPDPSRPTLFRRQFTATVHTRLVPLMPAEGREK